jgi:hypothetical protein
MGIAKDQIEGFVKSTDKLVVALGDEFKGGAEEVTKVFGQMRNVLTDIKTDNVSNDMLHLGNAVNVLGASGMATDQLSPILPAVLVRRVQSTDLQQGRFWVWRPHTRKWLFLPNADLLQP